jgi:hypothetical protein
MITSMTLNPRMKETLGLMKMVVLIMVAIHVRQFFIDPMDRKEFAMEVAMIATIPQLMGVAIVSMESISIHHTIFPADGVNLMLIMIMMRKEKMKK